MIKSIRGRDFQSHKDSTIEFGPGVNCIVGTSDSGKTSILRMLYWVLTNRPTTTSFIRTGSGSVGKRGAAHLGTAEVDVVVQRDGVEIAINRRKGHEENSCKVGKKDFNTLGKDVPEEVLEALNLQEINIQRQRDPAFLIDDSPGQVAAAFNRYTDLDKVDGIVGSLSSDIRQATMDKKRYEGDIEDIEKQLKTFDYLKDMEDFVSALEEVEGEIDAACDKEGDLSALLSHVQATTIDLKGVSAQAKSAADLFDSVVHAGAELRLLCEEYDTDIQSLEDLRYIVESTNDVTAQLDEIKVRLPLAKKEVDLQKSRISLASDIADAEIVSGELDTLLNTICAVGEDLSSTQLLLDAAKQLLVEEKAKLANVDTCVVCEQKLTKAGKEAMLRNLR